MKITSLLLLIFLGINTVLFAQECGTPSDTQNQDFPDFKRKGTGGNTIFTINIYFHIVRNTSGTNAFTTPDLDAIISNLNTYYSSHNITFRNAGSELIDNTNFVNNNNFVPLHSINDIETH